MTVTIDRAPPNDGQPLLVDLALRIAAFLLKAEHTLPWRPSTDAPKIITLLSAQSSTAKYLSSPRSLTLCSSWAMIFLSPDSLGKQVDSAVVSETIFSAERAVLRRILALQHIRHLSIHSLPADSSP